MAKKVLTGDDSVTQKMKKMTDLQADEQLKEKTSKIADEMLPKIKTEDLPEGVELEEKIEQVIVGSLKLNPLNKMFKDDNLEEYEDLKNDIQKRGIIVPLIVNNKGLLLAGHRRYKIAKELKFRTVPVQYLKEKFTLSIDQERELLFKDNIVRRHLTPQQKVELIKELYKPEIDEDRRGGDRKSNQTKIKSSNELLIPLPDKIEQQTGIKAGTAKRLLSKIRKELKGLGGEEPKVILDPVKTIEKYLQKIEHVLTDAEQEIKNKAISEIVDTIEILGGDNPLILKKAKELKKLL